MYLSYLKTCKNKHTFYKKNRVYSLPLKKKRLSVKSLKYIFSVFKNIRYIFPNNKFYEIYFKKFSLFKNYFKISTIIKYHKYAIKMLHIKYFKHLNNLSNICSYENYKFNIEDGFADRFLHKNNFLQKNRNPHWILMYIVKNYKLRLWRNFNKFREKINGYNFLFNFHVDNMLLYWYKYKYYLKFPFRGFFLPKVNFFFKYIIYSIIMRKNYYINTSKFLFFLKIIFYPYFF